MKNRVYSIKKKYCCVGNRIQLVCLGFHKNMRTSTRHVQKYICLKLCYTPCIVCPHLNCHDDTLSNFVLFTSTQEHLQPIWGFNSCWRVTLIVQFIKHGSNQRWMSKIIIWFQSNCPLPTSGKQEENWRTWGLALWQQTFCPVYSAEQEGNAWGEWVVRGACWCWACSTSCLHSREADQYNFNTLNFTQRPFTGIVLLWLTEGKGKHWGNLYCPISE